MAGMTLARTGGANMLPQEPRRPYAGRPSRIGHGTGDRTRTCNLPLAKGVLYPFELRSADIGVMPVRRKSQT